MAKGEKPKQTLPKQMSVAQKKQNQDEKAKPLDLKERQQHLKAQLTQKNAFAKLESKEQPQDNAMGSQTAQGMAQALKLSSEFLAGVVIGIVLGLGFDQLIDTSPWGLIVFLFLGFAAGVLNVLRSVGRVAPSQIGQRGLKNHNETHDTLEK